jgi:hypothetical protein
MNVFESLQNQLTPSALANLAECLGEPAAAAQQAVTKGAIPALAAGVLQRFSGDTGAARLLELLTAGKHDGGLLDNLAGALSGGAQTDTLVSLGKGLASSLLGDRSEAVTDLLASFAGVRRGSAASLLSLAAPLLLAELGKQAGGNVAGVLQMLGGLRGGLTAAAPPGLAAALGVADLEQLSAAAQERKGAVYPWLLVPASALALFFVLRSCSNQQAEPIPASYGQPVATMPAEPATDPVAPTSEPTGEPARP